MMRMVSMLFIVVLMGAVCTSSATAQKKETAKKEAAVQQSQGTMKEVLSQYIGKTTNLGTLKKVTGDYFVLEEDENIVMHPLYTLHTIKLLKDGESGETKIEIKLIGKD